MIRPIQAAVILAGLFVAARTEAQGIRPNVDAPPPDEQEGGGGGTGDTVPPGAATLTAVTVGETEVALITETPADNIGVTGVDFRYSTAPIDAADFDAATPIVDSYAAIPPPGPAGTALAVTACLLAKQTSYCFAVRFFDGAGNRSPVAVAWAKTAPLPEPVPPPPVPVAAPTADSGDGTPACGASATSMETWSLIAGLAFLIRR